MCFVEAQEERTKNKKNALVPILMERLVETKTPTVPTFIKSKENCAGTPRLHKEPIFGRAINMQSRRPTEQCFYVLEPSHGCHRKGKSALELPSLERTNKAINMQSRRPTEQ